MTTRLAAEALYFAVVLVLAVEIGRELFPRRRWTRPLGRILRAALAVAVLAAVVTTVVRLRSGG